MRRASSEEDDRGRALWRVFDNAEPHRQTHGRTWESCESNTSPQMNCLRRMADLKPSNIMVTEEGLVQLWWYTSTASRNEGSSSCRTLATVRIKHATQIADALAKAHAAGIVHRERRETGHQPHLREVDPILCGCADRVRYPPPCMGVTNGSDLPLRDVAG